MKHLKKAFIALLTTLVLTASGCAALAPAEDESEARLSALEEELAQVKEEKYQNEQAYYKEIATLKEEIERLTAAADQAPATNGANLIFHYKVEDGTATITGYDGTAALVHIPSTLDGYPVTKIGERAFEGNASLCAAIVPEGVTEIDWFAFYGCEGLQEISLPESISLIGHAVFDGCPDLVVSCKAGSYTEDYARSYGITVVTR